MNQQEHVVYRCENCESADVNMTNYHDMHSSQDVFHCASCGFIFWEHTVFRSK